MLSALVEMANTDDDDGDDHAGIVNLERGEDWNHPTQVRSRLFFAASWGNRRICALNAVC